MQLNTTIKMERKELIKTILFILIGLIATPTTTAAYHKSKTHNQLIQVNNNWIGLEYCIKHTFTPNSEQELVQLHLLNVLTYLESQPVNHLSEIQQKNRQFNISTLRRYTLAGVFPKNKVTAYRIPIFIDAQNTHCAVGYLLKANGLEQVAQSIAKKQLLSYLAEIRHPKLSIWQKTCGLSLFELALIQPTYGPPIPVCAAPSPIQWETVSKDTRITQFFDSKTDTTFYGIADVDAMGLKQEVKSYSTNSQLWTRIGPQVKGQVLDLALCKDEIYISVVLPEADYPHQLLRLTGTEWKKIAHFNGSIISMQVLNNNLYVLGNYTLVNSTIASKFVVLENDLIRPFRPIGLINTAFDHMKASKTALFLTSHGAIYKLKNDTIKGLTSIKHYQYISDISLDAVADSLYISSLSIQGYNTYYKHQERTSYLNNMLYGQDYPYRSIHFTQSKMINGRMMIAGDFKGSTLIPQINDERYLLRCADSVSTHWFGEGLLYQYGLEFYPILKEGIVMDFVQLNKQIFILKKDGSISMANLNFINDELIKLRKKASY